LINIEIIYSGIGDEAVCESQMLERRKAEELSERSYSFVPKNTM
jgi:hypothetical protein